MASAAGGTSQRLKPAPAMIRSRSRNPGALAALATAMTFLLNSERAAAPSPSSIDQPRAASNRAAKEQTISGGDSVQEGGEHHGPGKRKRARIARQLQQHDAHVVVCPCETLTMESDEHPVCRRNAGREQVAPGTYLTLPRCAYA